MRLTEELDMVLREVDGPGTDFRFLRGRLDDWDVRYLIWKHLGMEINSGNPVADRVAMELVPVFEDVLRDRGAPRGGFDAVAADLVKLMTLPELIAMMKDLGLADELLPEGTTVAKLARNLKPIVAKRLSDALTDTTNRWKADGNFELKARRRALDSRDRSAEPLSRPYEAPTSRDARRP